MKSITKTIFILCIFFCKNLQAQQHCDTLTFQSKYWFQDFHGVYITKLFAFNGNIFITGDTGGPIEHTRLDEGDANITKLTDRGTPLWSKNIGAYRSNDRVFDVKQTSDGGFIIAGAANAKNIYSDGWIARLDANASIKWTFVFPAPSSALTKVIQLNDGGFAAVGFVYLSFDGDELGNIPFVYSGEAFVVRLDKDGNKVWSKSFSATKDINAFYSIMQMNDGNLIVSGSSHRPKILSSDDYVSYILKIDNNTGKIIWSESTDFIGTLEETPDHNIRILDGHNISYFDGNGKNIRNIEFNLPGNSLNGQNMLYISSKIPGEDYYIIANRYPVLFKIKSDSAVEWARTYSYQSSPGHLDGIGDAIFADEGFYLGGAINTQYFPDSSYGVNDLPYLIKTDANGKTSCSDTFSTPFIFTTLSLQNNNSISFKEGLPPEPSPVSMYSQNILPHRIFDCYDITCCKDTVIYKNASVCEGSSYTLPDGNIVNTAGIYPIAYKKITDCDSVIYVTTALQKDIKVSLGNDTCFSNSNAITYKLSFPVQVKYQWQDGSTDSIYIATQPGQYWVRVTSLCNISADSVSISEKCDFPLYIPNAFTPNNDGRNDIFRIADLRRQHLIDFSIYNRFAQRIFFTTDSYDGWDGMINGVQQPKGTYVYIIRYTDLEGRYHELKGTVVLVR